jgi:hypothetical protein
MMEKIKQDSTLNLTHRNYLLLHCSKNSVIDYFRPLNSESQQLDDSTPINLGASSLGLHKADQQLDMWNQKSTLEEYGILRPKLATTPFGFGAGECDNYAMQSENGKNCDHATWNLPSGSYRAFENSEEHVGQQDGLNTWVHDQEHVSFGNEDETEHAQTIDLNHHKRDSMTEVKYEGNAVNTADNFSKFSRLQNGHLNKRSIHLDDPISSHSTPVEADAGQMAYSNSASPGYECDGNSFISLTRNSKQ